MIALNDSVSNGVGNRRVLGEACQGLIGIWLMMIADLVTARPSIIFSRSERVALSMASMPQAANTNTSVLASCVSMLVVRSGADALVVSNHGGRRLDGALSSIAALPAIVDAVGSQIESHLDSGIRSAQDVSKALALGAHGVRIGRAFASLHLEPDFGYTV